MTTRRQRAVLKVICDNCREGLSCMISEGNIVAFCADLKLVNKENVSSILKDLENEDYVDLVESNKKEDKLYCITLHVKGKNYLIDYKRNVKALRNRILLAVICACISFLVGRILLVIFT